MAYFSRDYKKPNTAQNREFRAVCKQLGIDDPEQQARFHDYLHTVYADPTALSYPQLLEAGRQFLAAGF